MELSLPQILSRIGIRGYSKELSSSVNTLLNTNTDIDYKDALRTATVEITGYELNVIESDIDGYGESQLQGLPLYMPLLLEKVDGIREDFLLDSAIVEANRQKRIVLTDLQGRDTSVKEFINNGDYSLSVTGIISNRVNLYPKENVKSLVEYLAAKKAIPIVHEKLNLLGIYEIVVTDYNLPHSPFMNIQPYSFNAISDSPLILQ